MVLRVYGDMTFLEMSLLPRVLCRLIRLFGSKLLLFFLKVGGSGVSGKTKKKKKEYPRSYFPKFYTMWNILLSICMHICASLDLFPCV